MFKLVSWDSEYWKKTELTRIPTNLKESLTHTQNHKNHGIPCRWICYDHGFRIQNTSFPSFSIFSQLLGAYFFQDQMAVFQTPAEDVCHFVLASNVAESSLTLPNVSAVVDLGMNKQQVTLVDLFFCWLWPFFAGRNREEIDFGFGWVVVFCRLLCRFLEGPNMEPLFWDKDRNVIVTKGIGPCTPRRKNPQPLSKKKNNSPSHDQKDPEVIAIRWWSDHQVVSGKN